VRDETEQSLIDTETLIQRWHGVDRLGYAITPRFAPTSTPAQLRGAGELAARYPMCGSSPMWPRTWTRSWVASCSRRAQLPGVYDDFGLMRERAVYAHCIWLDDEDRALMRDTRTAAAISPTSNLFPAATSTTRRPMRRISLRPGQRCGRRHELFAVSHHAGRLCGGARRPCQAGPEPVAPALWWQHTAGAAQALGLRA
jgi:guanine deaminase